MWLKIGYIKDFSFTDNNVVQKTFITQLGNMWRFLTVKNKLVDQKLKEAESEENTDSLSKSKTRKRTGSNRSYTGEPN